MGKTAAARAHHKPDNQQSSRERCKYANLSTAPYDIHVVNRLDAVIETDCNSHMCNQSKQYIHYPNLHKL